MFTKEKGGQREIGVIYSDRVLSFRDFYVKIDKKKKKKEEEEDP